MFVAAGESFLPPFCEAAHKPALRPGYAARILKPHQTTVMAAMMQAAVRARSRTWTFIVSIPFLYYPTRRVCDSTTCGLAERIGTLQNGNGRILVEFCGPISSVSAHTNASSRPLPLRAPLSNTGHHRQLRNHANAGPSPPMNLRRLNRQL